MANEYDDVLSVNPILEALAKKGSGRVIELRGFVGPSDSTVVRLFESLQMESYLEIPKSDVLYALSDSKSENGAVIVFVRGEAELLSVATHRIRADAIHAAGLTAESAEGAPGCGDMPRVIRRFKVPLFNEAEINSAKCNMAYRRIRELVDILENGLRLPYGGRVRVTGRLRGKYQLELISLERFVEENCDPSLGSTLDAGLL